MSIPFLPAFLVAISMSSARARLLGSSCYSLNYQYHLGCKFTSLASNLATNRFQIGYSCLPFTPQRWPSILVISTSSLYAIASASLCLLQSPLPTSYLISCLSWLSTCWHFSLEFPPSSSQIYRLLHCHQIQSKNSPFLWCKHIWPLTVLSTRF